MLSTQTGNFKALAFSGAVAISVIPFFGSSVTVAQQADIEPYPLVCMASGGKAFLDQLAKEAKEEPRSIGVNAGGRLFTLYRNKETGTWTALIFKDSQTPCILALGTDYYEEAEKKGEGL